MVTATLQPTPFISDEPIRRLLQGSILRDIREKTSGLSKRQWVLSATLAGSVAAAVASLLGGATVAAYIGLFGFGVFSNAIPVPFGGSAVTVSAAMFLNPILVSVPCVCDKYKK